MSIIRLYCCQQGFMFGNVGKNYLWQFSQIRLQQVSEHANIALQQIHELKVSVF